MKLKTFASLLFSVLFIGAVKAQTTETFETETNGATSFTDNSQVFNITTQASGPFSIDGTYPGTGWNGTAADNKYIDNDGHAIVSVPVAFTISSAGSVAFVVKSMWLYLADQNANVNVSGSLTIVGKLGGVTKFTTTASSGFNTNVGVNNGFSFINMSTFGGADNSNTNIDQIVISTGNSFYYVAFDAFRWNIPPTPSINTSGTLSAFTSCNGSVSTAQTFTVSGTNLTTSITVTAPTGFEVSTSSGSGYGSSLNLNPSSGTVSNTTIYARLTASASGTPSGNITCASTGATTQSVAVSGTVNTLPAVTGNPASQTLCAGSATTFTISATGTSLTYQWRKNSSNLSNTGVYTGATTATLSISDVTGLSGSTFDCSVLGACSPPATSSTATLTGSTAPSISASPSSTSICAGNNTSFVVVATGTNLTYQWQADQGSGLNSLNNGSLYSGVTTATLTITGATAGLNGYIYRCIVNGTCPPSANSGSATLTINTAPSVTGNPANQTLCAGFATTFTISATGTSLTYQWRKNSSNLSNTGVYTGATTATLSISDVTGLSGSTFDCMVSGVCSPSATSSTATLTVNTAPSISSQPTSSTICAGSNATFAVAATGTNMVYQWQVAQSAGFNNISNNANYSGATTSALTVTSALVSLSGSYRCVISGTCPSSVNSNTVTLTVNSTPNVTSVMPVARCGTGTVVIGATANIGTLDWYAANNGGSSLGVGSSFTTPTLSLTTTYFVEASNNGCTSGRTSVQATVNNLPTVIANASSSTLCTGKSTTLTGGGASSYVWSGGITDAIGFVPSATATYTVTGTDANTCTNTATVTVEVNPAIANSLTIASPLCGTAGGSISTAVSGGTSPFLYLWNNANTTSTITGLTGLPTQTLIVTITDSKGCTRKDTALVSCVLAVKENVMGIDLNIYPNPINGQFIVGLKQGQLIAGDKYILEIYNSIGEKIYFTILKETSLNGPISEEPVTLDVPDGIYFLKIQSDKQSSMQKIIIAK